AVPERFESASVPVPTFGAYAETPSGTGNSRLLFRRVATLLIFGAAGYFAWTRLQPTENWSALIGLLHTTSDEGSKPSAPATPVAQAPVEATNVADSGNARSSGDFATPPAS